MESPQISTFPAWVFNYPQLQHLRIFSSAETAKIPLKWSNQLPLPLEVHTPMLSLHLDFLNSALVLSSLGAHRTLANMCPNLTALSCCSLGALDPDWLHNLPPKLVTLRITATPISSIVSVPSACISALPQSLESLELEGLFVDVEGEEEITWLPRLRHLTLHPAPSSLLLGLPENLESMNLSWKDVRPHLRVLQASLLPRRLRRFSLVDALLGKMVLDSPLPSSLTQLHFSECTFWRTLDETVDESNCDDLDQYFPASLVDVRLSNINPSHIGLLPIFYALKELVVDARLASRIGNTDSHAPLALPPKLTSLIMSEEAPSPRLLNLLPITVQRIKAPIRDTAQCDALAHLTSLRHLHILPDSPHVQSTALPPSFWKRVCPMLETLITPLSKSQDPPRDLKASFLSSASLLGSSASNGSDIQLAKEWALLGSRLKVLELVLDAKSASQYRPEMVMRMLPTSITSLGIHIERFISPPQAEVPSDFGTMDSDDSLPSPGADASYSASTTLASAQHDDCGSEAGPEWFLYFSRFTNLRTLSIRDSRPASSADLEADGFSASKPFLSRLPVSLRKLSLELPHLPPDSLYRLPSALESLSIKRSTPKSDPLVPLTSEHFAFFPLSLLELRLDFPHDPLPSFFDNLPKSIVVLQDGHVLPGSTFWSPAIREAVFERKTLDRRFNPDSDLSGLGANEESLSGLGNLHLEDEEDGEEIIEEDPTTSEDDGESSSGGSFLGEDDFSELMNAEETEQFYEEQREELRQSQAIAKAMALGLPRPMSPTSPKVMSPSVRSPAISPPSSSVLSRSGAISPPPHVTAGDARHGSIPPWDVLHSSWEHAKMSEPMMSEGEVGLEMDSDVEDHILDFEPVETEYEGFYLLPRSPPSQAQQSPIPRLEDRVPSKKDALQISNSRPASLSAASPRSAPEEIEDPPQRSSLSSVGTDDFELI